MFFWLIDWFIFNNFLETTFNLIWNSFYSYISVIYDLFEIPYPIVTTQYIPSYVIVHWFGEWNRWRFRIALRPPSPRIVPLFSKQFRRRVSFYHCLIFGWFFHLIFIMFSLFPKKMWLPVRVIGRVINFLPYCIDHKLHFFWFRFRPGFENDDDANSSKRRKRGSIFFRKRKVRLFVFFRNWRCVFCLFCWIFTIQWWQMNDFSTGQGQGEREK